MLHRLLSSQRAINASKSSLYVLPTRLMHNPIRIRGKGPKAIDPSETIKTLHQLNDYNQLPELITTPVVPLMLQPITANVYNWNKEAVSTIELDPEVFQQEIRKDIVKKVVDWQRAKARQGTKKTKTRSEVSGSNKKPFPQKGTGNARASTFRAPHMRGGGDAHGIRPRDYEYSLDKKVRAKALKIVLSAKLKEGNLYVIDNAEFASHKTQDLVDSLNKFNLQSVLYVHEPTNTSSTSTHIHNLSLAGRNLQSFDMIPSTGLNCYDILKRQGLCICIDSIHTLTQRLKYSNTINSRVRFGVGSQGNGISARYINWTEIRDKSIAAGLPVPSTKQVIDEILATNPQQQQQQAQQ